MQLQAEQVEQQQQHYNHYTTDYNVSEAGEWIAVIVQQINHLKITLQNMKIEMRNISFKMRSNFNYALIKTLSQQAFPTSDYLF